MAAGPPTAWFLELELTAGVWTDVTSFVRLDQGGVSISQCRDGTTGEIKPGDLQVVLDNSDSRWLLDNPNGPYYQKLVEGTRVRWRVTKGTTTVRFIGPMVSCTPEYRDGEPVQSVATLTASDALSSMTWPLNPDYIDQVRYDASVTGGGATAEAFTLQPTANPRSFANADPAGPNLSVIYQTSTSRTGSMTTGDAQGLPGLGQVDIVSNGAGGWAPMLLLKPRSTSVGSGTTRVMFAFKTQGVQSGLAYGEVFSAWSGEKCLTRLQMNADGSLVYFNSSGGSAAVPGATAGWANDDQWHYVWLTDGGAGTTGLFIDAFLASAPTTGVTINPCDFSTITHLFWGGHALSTSSTAKMTNGWTGQIAGISCTRSTALGAYAYLIHETQAESAGGRIIDVGNYQLIRGGAAIAIAGTDGGLDVTLAAETGTPLDLVEKVRASCGAEVWWKPSSDQAVFLFSDTIRPLTPDITIDAEADLDATAGFPWLRDVDGAPTRVTVSWPGGSVEVVGSKPETGGRIRSMQLDTIAADETHARSIAGFWLGRPLKAELQTVAVDLVTAVTDLYSAAMSVQPGYHVRVSNLPSNYFGLTYADGFVVGWTEQYSIVGGVWSVVFTFRLDAFDAYPAATADDAEFGRAATNGDVVASSGTAVGNTGNGTIVLTLNTTTVGWSTSAGDYPADVDWNGERVTIGSAPAAPAAGSQTLTITARGVAPTTARAHAAGEPVEVWHAAAATW